VVGNGFQPGVNFINILLEAFTLIGLKSILDLTVFFALLGSVRVKATCKTLMKLTPGPPAGNVKAVV